MELESYPALYRAADAASMKAQRRYLRAVAGYSLLLIAAAGLGVYGIQETKAGIAAALVIIGSIFISVWMVLNRDEDIWYRARAVAESVKTSTWRFMMRADPFPDSETVDTVKAQFRQRLMGILNEHKDLAHALAGTLSREHQITNAMCIVREMNLEDRIKFYQHHRIDEQRTWYADKSEENKRKGRKWFAALILCQFAAVVLVTLRVGYPDWGYWPAEVFVVASGSTLTWIQVKRFRELAAAYGLTAHEVGVLRGGLETATDDPDFAQFVSDSEAAFSREHTQWLARKDTI